MTPMAYTTANNPSAPTFPFLGRLRQRLANARQAFATYRRQREIYLRTLHELQSYRPHELHDLRIQTDDIERLAREQAGW